MKIKVLTDKRWYQLDSLNVDRWNLWVTTQQLNEVYGLIFRRKQKSTNYHKKHHFYLLDSDKYLVAPQHFGMPGNILKSAELADVLFYHFLLIVTDSLKYYKAILSRICFWPCISIFVPKNWKLTEIWL